MNTTSTDIAIIGMACRFPCANNYEEYWNILQQARSCIREVPPERWDWRQHWGDPSKGKSISKWGGFVNDADCFDAAFFNHSGKEAESMDPQQRLMLQLSWDCLEDAGIPPSQLSGSNTGVYIGVFNADYKELEEKAGFIEAHYGTGTATAVIPNRISYYYNFNGPSLPVDTACSSSLHAIHLAAQSIHLGECDLALAGGVNLLFTPSRYIAFSKAGMLSPTGSCKTFDEKADGYVRSEGAALVVLKSLQKALEDGDTIHGILKGSAVNHGGKAHTLTYPKPETQAAVIMAAMKRAGVSPETISYVEAHGTGTPKGDPIEFQGLVKAFTAHLAEGPATLASGYCALGSAKSNIGHLESAAGVAGLIKVLLAMKHKQLPALANFQQLNHRIEPQGTPFYILDRLQEWRRLTTADGKELPRRAGVSSFGFGGTNAHVILEEPPVIPQPAPAAGPAYLVCLSAKTVPALRQKIRDLSTWLDEQPADLRLSDLSCTLLMGREHFDVRKAFAVHQLPALKSALRTATVPEADQQPALSASEIASCDALMKTLHERMDNPDVYTEQLRLLAGWYERGYKGDWSLLSGGAAFKRIALPAYPFAKTPYWIPGRPTAPAALPLHPLPQENSLSATEQRFTATFTGEEPFLRDHVIKGRRILPGVAYLEMVRAAAQRTAIQIRNVVWAAPFIAEDQQRALLLSLRPSSTGNTVYEIYTEDDPGKKTLHSQGSITPITPEHAPAQDLAALQQACNKHAFSGNAYYAALSKGGFGYGPSHKAIEQVYIGEETVLAKLSLPGDHAYILHPGLMDAGLQLSMAWLVKDAEHSGHMKTLLPFALDELSVYSACTADMYAIARYSTGSGPHAAVQKLDIDLCDAAGNVCVRMKGFSGRLLEKETNAIRLRTFADVMQLRACWRERAATGNPAAAYDGHIVIFCEASLSALSFVSNTMPNVQCFSLAPAAGPIEQQFTTYSWQLLEIIRRIVKERPAGKLLLQVLTPGEGQRRLLAALKGGMRTAAIEYPRLSVQLIEHTAASLQSVTDILQQDMHTEDEHIRYENGRRLVKEWEDMDNIMAAGLPWREGGVYLVTGGTGGLGSIFAREIVSRNSHVTLILTGRSALTADKEAQLQQLGEAGANIIFRQTDISDKAAVQRLIRWIKDAHGGLNGILHCAGLLRDSFIARKTEQELQAVLAPKVAGLVHLDEASRDIALDFMVLFSSFTAVLGNIGQADYALANCFMDEYAHYRNGLVKQGQRTGVTLSLNWPLWKEGGMQVNETAEKQMWTHAGVKPMATAAGINAFYAALQDKAGQVVVIQGDTERVKKKLLRDTHTTAPLQPLPAPPAAGVLSQLLQYAAAILKMDAANLDGDTGLEEYGFDSILYTEFTNRLNEAFSLELAPTIFFEYPNLAALAAYLGGQSTAMPAPAAGAQLQPATATPPQNTGSSEALREQVTALLIGHAAEILKVPAQHLDAITGIDEYGFDSILYTEFTNRLNDVFGLELAPTIFFEYASFHALAVFLTSEHHSAFAAKLAPAAAIQEPVQEAVAQQPLAAVKPAADRISGGPDPIAIIGMSGKFPMADDPESLWKNLLAEKDCISEVPADRWDWKAYYGNAATEPGKTRIKWGGFMEGATAFDPSFFKISPAEAAYMDPHQRLLMMYVWKAIEDAGYAPETLSGSNTALFAGMSNHDFSGLMPGTGMQVEGYTSTGIISCVGPNRMSYFLDLHGPSEPVETACSSSLVAIHRAVRAIQSGDCDMAIAGGVQALLSPRLFISFNKAGMLSEDGRCKTFSSQANGYTRGEGVGMVLLKRLSDAERDGDHIYGVIRATAENHGGHANSLTAPNMHAQAALLKTAYTRAGIDPRTVTYIEAHGTGTKLGDPIEVNALKAAFNELYTASGDAAVNTRHCGLGSIKTNIGHLEYAAGIAGVIKVLLQLQHRTLVKSLHSEEINPYIQLEGSPFYIVQQSREWKALRDANGRELPRRAGVSSFGFGGVNAHVVIEEYIPAPAEDRYCINETQPGIFILSARNRERLREQAMQLLAALEANDYDERSLAAVAYTLQTGRNAMEERLGIIAGSSEALRTKLRAFAAGKTHISGLYHGRAEKQAALPADARPPLQDLATTGEYSKLAEGWVKGHSIDWLLLYPAVRPRRISLPSYPFAKEQYWLDTQATAANEPTMPAPPPAPVPAGEQLLPPAAAPLDNIRQLLVQQASQLLKIREENIIPDTGLDEYGFDSVMFTQFSNQLNELLHLELTPTIFFEHPSLEELAAYLQKTYGDRLVAAAPPPEPARNTPVQQPVRAATEAAAPIAIIGMSGEFPMAKDLQEFWDNLLAGKDCMSRIPADRWDHQAYPDSATHWGGFIDGMSTFDPLFFNISPAEAMHMDPQHRLLMMYVWKAIEDAGYAPHTLSGSNTGIFTGVTCYEYNRLLLQAGIPPEAHSSTGMVASLAPNRMSYFLNLHGPSQPVETACSSSLVAIHRAVDAIRNGTCDMAIAGGVNAILAPEMYENLARGGMLSADGRCKAFSDKADGYARGEGAGMLLLKRLADAERDGDHIYGLVRSTAENHGGRATSLTAPNPKAQVQLLLGAYRKAGIDARTVTYIEAHGTGTPLGDPIETGALKTAFSELLAETGTTAGQEAHCGLGSVKTNIGHLEVAAGVAGVIKVLLQLQHKTLVKSLHSETLNPYIQLEGSPFYVVQQNRPWEALRDADGNELPRRAGISSFGFGGVNAHVVIEEYIPPVSASYKPGRPQAVVITLSARNKERLQEYSRRLLAAFEKTPPQEAALEPIAYTLQTGREQMEERIAFTVSSVPGLLSALRRYCSGEDTTGIIWQGSVQLHKKLQVDARDMAAQVSAWIAEGLTGKLAEHWVKGYPVDWHSLYGAVRPPRISLPTYPFARNRYWVTAKHKITKALNNDQKEAALLDGHAAAEMTDERLLEKGAACLKSILEELLMIPAAEIAADLPFEQYGVDSMIATRLMSRLRRVYSSLENNVLAEYPTISELLEHLVEKDRDALIRLVSPEEQARPAHAQFPELIRMNGVTEGRPVFWMHPIGGGVESYQAIAAASKRPFYGIAAGNWTNDPDRINGIPQLAAYYIGIVRSLQPAGPYDLGGYSLGGALAYEMARQLQEAGEAVKSIVILDAIYAPGLMDRFVLSYKSMVLQLVNFSLLASASGQTNGTAPALIHRDETPLDAPDNDFLREVTALARARGLQRTAEQLHALAQTGMAIQRAGRLSDYKVLPLADPDGLSCYYFRNGSRSFYGSLAPYCITAAGEELPLDHVPYWDAWERQLTHFKMADLGAASHVTLMNDPAVLQQVLALCEEIYAPPAFTLLNAPIKKS